jgi:hypothetical protein
MPAPNLGDWGAAASAFFAATAAGAALLTARQGREALHAAELPFLEVQVLADPGTGMLGLSIVNTGRGVARGATFALHALGRATDSPLDDGFMQSGDRLHVVTDIGPLPTDSWQGDLPDLAAMVGYRDADGFAHYRTHTGKHLTPRTRIRRHPKYPERVSIFRQFFPHVDLDAATRAECKLARPPQLTDARPR